MTACVCGTPPAVANGEVKYSGPYLNGSKAEYDCDDKYTNAGKDSLLCLADSTCSNPSWTIDSTDTNSGYPDCQAVVPDYDTFNTYNNSGSSGFSSWALLAVMLCLLLLLLIAVILMCWYWCCRECCRRCCMRRCPGCNNCCYEVPYGYPPPERVVYHKGGNRKTTTVYHNSNNVQPANRGVVAPRKEVIIVNGNSRPQPTPTTRKVTPEKPQNNEKREDLTSPSDVSVRAEESVKSYRGETNATTPRQSKVVVMQQAVNPAYQDTHSQPAPRQVYTHDTIDHRERRSIDEDYLRRHLGYTPNAGT